MKKTISRHLVILAAVWPCAAFAEIDFKPYTGAQYQYYSNLFEVSGKQEAIEQNGTSKRSDSALSYLAGLGTSIGFGQQKVSALAEVRRVNFDRFSDLDHNEHRYAGGLDWKLGSVLDGGFEYRQERRLASFSELDISELTLRRDETLGAKLNLQVTPVWRLETLGEQRTYELPLPDSPQFRLREKVANVAIRYVGVASLSAGLLGTYTDGEFTGVPDARTFDETSLQFVADYAISGLTRLNLRVGGVRRKQESTVDQTDENAVDPANDEVEGFTGALGLTRELSEKTSFNAQVYRQVDSYVVGANSLINTGAGAGLSWAPTEKTRFGARYDWTQTKFQDEPIDEPGENADVGRKDKFKVASLEMTYRALDWLSFRPFAEYRDRTSTLNDAEFDAFVGGLEMRAGFK